MDFERRLKDLQGLIEGMDARAISNYVDEKTENHSALVEAIQVIEKALTETTEY